MMWRLTLGPHRGISAHQLAFTRLQKLHGSTHPCSSSPTLCFAKFFSRFLHDKNSREFLYYRKKVAEIRKEAQKLQTASQKGRWVKGRF